MDNTRKKLQEQVIAWLAELSDDQIGKLINQARDEALADVRRIVKDMMVSVLLRRVSQHASEPQDQQAPQRGVLPEEEFQKDSLKRASVGVPVLPEQSESGEQGTVLDNEEPQEQPITQEKVLSEEDSLECANAGTPLQQEQSKGDEQAVALDQEEGSRDMTVIAVPVLQEEIEVIRQKIVANEEELRQIGAGTTETMDSQTIVNPTTGADNLAESVDTLVPDQSEQGYGYYVYGVIRNQDNQPVLELSLPGVDPNYTVYTLHHLSLQALVSQVLIEEFGQAAIEVNMQDATWLQEKAYRHQQILEAVHVSCTVIPMKFGAIYHSQQRLQEMLIHYHDAFVEELLHLEGKREWGVKMYCDVEMLGRHVELNNERILTLKADLEKKPRGSAYLLKKGFANIVAEEARHVREDVVQHSHTHLATYAERAVINAVQNPEALGKSNTLILNAAYLVLMTNEMIFAEQLAALEAEYADYGIRYELIGPWPPYNFITIRTNETETS